MYCSHALSLPIEKYPFGLWHLQNYEALLFMSQSPFFTRVTLPCIQTISFPFSSFMLLWLNISHCSQGPQCGVPVIWICLREEVNNIFENCYQQQELALPSLLISVEEGPGLGGVRQAPAWGREAALTHFCAKSWYLITSLPRWWDQFACCFVSHHCHLMSLLPCRKGQGLWQQNTTAGSYWCSHVYIYPAQWFCRSYIIVNHSNLLVSFHYPSMVCIRALPCVTTHFCPLVSEKVLNIVAGILNTISQTLCHCQFIKSGFIFMWQQQVWAVAFRMKSSLWMKIYTHSGSGSLFPLFHCLCCDAQSK